MTGGHLISLEGLDGVGKTTQIAYIRAWLESRSTPVTTVREPGGTEFGEALRHLILHRVEPKSALAEFLVFAAARAELMETVVLPALSQGQVVLMDRFIDSSIAYQAFGKGLAAETVETINRAATQGRRPDLTVWLRGQPFIKKDGDQMETRDREYFRRVEQGYVWVSHREPDRWLTIDSGQKPDIIFDTLMARIERMLQEEGGEP